MKKLAIAAIVALTSVGAAMASTYQVNVNQYGGTTYTLIDNLNHPCTQNICYPVDYHGYLFNGEIYRSRVAADLAAQTWFNSQQYNADINTSALTAPLNSTSSSLQDKIDQAVGDFAAAYGEAAAQQIYTKVLETAQGNAEIRFEQHNNNEVWWTLTDQVGNTFSFFGTGLEADSELASLVFDQINDYTFQTNKVTGQIRIKLINNDGSYFNTDWIYAYSTEDLLAGLVEESYQEGFSAGYESGYGNGYEDGYVDGYIDGFRDGVASTQ